MSPTTQTIIDEALVRLESASLVVEGGWVATEWLQRTGGADPHPVAMKIETYHLRQVGVFEKFSVHAGVGVDLEVDLELPETLHGVSLIGEPLQLTINSLRPIDILVDGARVFGDSLPVVASGPALIDVVHEIRAGHNGRLTLRVLPTAVPLDGDWGRTGVTIQFTTPSLRARWHILDLALARLELAREFATTDDQVASTIIAANAVPADFDILTTAELTEIFGGSTSAQGLAHSLRWLDAVLVGYHIHCIGHSHIDLAWLWTYDDTREVIFRDMRSVVELFDDYPEFRFTHSQARGYCEIEESHPQLFTRLVDLIAAGRLEPATMQWVEADVNLPSGPAQARQIIEGVRYSRERLGVSPTVFLAPDTFGHSGNLPQLAKQAGAEVYYSHRANAGFSEVGRHWQCYWWEGDDGSRLLTVGTPIYLGPVTASRLARDIIDLGVRNGITEICYFYGVGDHGGGPTRADLDTIRALNASAVFPLVRCSTVSEYVHALLATKPNLPVVRGESEHVFEGTYITHSDAKRMNRESENALVEAETLAAMAGIDPGEQLSTAWRGVLHHQFHDILGGSAVAGAYAHQSVDAQEALRFARALSARALAAIASRVTPGTLVVTNPLGTHRHDVVTVAAELLGGQNGVTDPAGSVIPSQISANGDLVFVAELGAFESIELTVGSASQTTADLLRVTTDVRPGFLEIESQFFRAEIRLDSGIVTTLVDQTSGRTLVGRTGNSPESMRQLRPELGLGALVYTHELPHPMTSWVADDVDYERVLLGTGSTTVVEQGPVRVVLETRHEFLRSKATVRTTFYAALPWIDYEIEVDWREIGSSHRGVPALGVSFGTRLPSPDLWVESPFSAVRREPDGYLGAMLRWADLGSKTAGLLVANDSKYAVDALGPRMRIALVRSAYDPDPVSDAGRIDITRLRVYPHSGPWQDAGVLGIAAGLNHPLKVNLADGTTGGGTLSILKPHIEGNSSVAIAALRYVANGVIAQVYDASGRGGRATIAGLAAGCRVSRCDLLGAPQESFVSDSSGRIELDFRPFELKTLRLDRE